MNPADPSQGSRRKNQVVGDPAPARPRAAVADKLPAMSQAAERQSLGEGGLRKPLVGSVAACENHDSRSHSSCHLASARWDGGCPTSCMPGSCSGCALAPSVLRHSLPSTARRLQPTAREFNRRLSKRCRSLPGTLWPLRSITRREYGSVKNWRWAAQMSARPAGPVRSTRIRAIRTCLTERRPPMAATGTTASFIRRAAPGPLRA